MSEKTTNIPCPGCGFPMKQGESVVLNLGPGPAVRHATCVEAPLLRFKCPDHGIFEAHGYDNPVFYADKVADCPKCGAKCWQPADNKPDTSLSLLVIDLGDSCVIRLESGEPFQINHGTDWWIDALPKAQICHRPFAAVRDAIDSQDKPVPRIELSSDIGEGLQTYRLYLRDDEMLVCPERSFVLDRKDLDALGDYVGRPLPIWTGGGKWEEIKGGYVLGDSRVNSLVELPVKIWRYTR